MSYMYSLLNQIPATSKEPLQGIGSFGKLNEVSDAATLYSLDSGIRGLTEDEKRLVGMSTISVVTRLALEFHDEEVCAKMTICCIRDTVLTKCLGHTPDCLYVIATLEISRTCSRSCYSLQFG